MQSFHELKVWQKAHDLAVEVYEATRPFPNDERFGITNQLRRAAVSVAANIAEGCGRGSDPDFARFLHNAMGSASEVEYLLLFSRDLNFLPSTRYDELVPQIIETKRMLAALIARLKADS